MSKHTPGPWIIEDHADAFTVTAKLDVSKYIADVHKWIIKDSDAETDANGRLIASAPEMLELLKDAGSQIHSDICKKECCETCKKISLLVSKIDPKPACTEVHND